MPNVVSPVPVKIRRHGQYFGSFPAPASSGSSSTDSTWEFTSHSSSMSDATLVSDATCVSPAQAIVMQFRAKEQGLSNSSSILKISNFRPKKTENSALPFPTGVEPEFTNRRPFVFRQVEPIFRQSRYDALEEFREEAHRIMRQSGVGPEQPLVCRECRDTVNNVTALTFHLHIHAIHNRSHECSQCARRYETRRELGIHQCTTQPPVSPVRDGFQRALRKVSLCK